MSTTTASVRRHSQRERVPATRAGVRLPTVVLVRTGYAVWSTARATGTVVIEIAVPRLSLRHWSLRERPGAALVLPRVDANTVMYAPATVGGESNS